MRLLGQKILLTALKGYQHSLSPDQGWYKAKYPYGYCRFYPSCSQYAYDSIQKHGVIKGVLLASWRVLKCNPWNPGGYDLVK